MDPNNPITYFAETDARNKKVKFGIKAKDRLRHTYVIGKTGMGKSTLLENLAVQDILNGEGLAVIDPHGSMAEKLLEYVPEHRIKDVIYFAPFDMEFPIAFNVMEDVDPDKRHLVVNGLMATFEKLWADSWSARMAYILQYAILGLLEYPDSTLLGINKMLSDKEYRKKVVDNVTDASVKSFWIDEFGKYTERFAAEATPAIQNKVGQFTSNALVRNIVGQSQSSFDLRTVMDQRKILIINLSKGQVGEGNAKLLGSMLITKIYLAAMSRADVGEAALNKLPNFYLYVDEFQSFANKSFADILSEARKYKLSLTVAHQYVEQMEEEVRDAVFGNVGTMVTFRVGALDAELLEKEFAPVFTAEDLVNLGFAQIYLKLMIDGVSSAPFSATTLPPIAKPEISFKDKVIDSSRKTYGRVRVDVENDVNKFYESGRGLQPTPNISQNQNQNYGQGNGQRPPQGSFNRAPESRTELRAPLSPEMELSAPQRRNTDTGFQSRTENKPTQDENKMVFAKAKEELEKKSVGNNQSPTFKPEIRQDNRSPVQQNNSIQKPLVSLADLRPEHEKAKVPTKENVNSLKDALAAVMGKKVEERGTSNEVRNTNNQKQTEKNTQDKVQDKKPEIIEEKKTELKTEIKEDIKQNPETTSSQTSNLKSQNSSVKEVPEDVLRKLLDLEAPKIEVRS